MDQHTRHIAPARRRERKTVFADSRWKHPTELLQINRDKKQEEEKCINIV